MSKDILQLRLSVAQLEKIRYLLDVKGIYNKSVDKVVDTLEQPAAPVGEFADVYDYISSIIKDSNQVDTATKFWFSAASSINKDDTNVAADNFIRGLTQYGLEYRNKLTGYSQEQINQGIQRTSNLIGQNVVTQILQEGGIPVFSSMLTNDIAAAILTELPDRNFEQDAGGWGGSFYYWNQAINYGQTGPRLTVGDAILNGLPATATPTAVSQPASLDEFVFANSKATVDALLITDKTLIGANLAFGKLDFGRALSYGMKAFSDSWTSADAGLHAKTPGDIKGQLMRAAALDIANRVNTGNFEPGPHRPDFLTTPRPISTYSGDQIQTTYADGDTVASDLGLDGDQAQSHWTSADGTTGDIVVTPNAAGALTATVAWKDGLGPGSTGTLSFNADRTSLGKASGSMTHSDGVTSTIALDAEGGITVDNLDADGDRVSRDWWRADGTHGVVAYDGGVMTARYTYRVNGEVAIEEYAANGTQTDQQIARAGALVNPDGTGFGKVVNADGSYSVNFTDAYGDTSIFRYSAAGALQGTNHSSASRTDPSDYASASTDGQTFNSPYNSTTAVVTDQDGTRRTLYFDYQGRQIAQDWEASDSRHGRDTFEADGSIEGERYGGPIVGRYDIAVTANRGAEMSSAKIYLSTYLGVQGDRFQWSGVATKGAGTASWGSEGAEPVWRDSSSLEGVGAPHLSTDPSAGLPPPMVGSEDISSTLYYALNGDYLGSSRNDSTESQSEPRQIGERTVIKDLGALAGGANAFAIPPGGQTLVFTAPGAAPGQAHVYATVTTPIVWPALQTASTSIPGDRVDVTDYADGVRTVRTRQNWYVVSQSETWGHGQYWMNNDGPTHSTMTARLPGGITLDHDHYYLDGKLLGFDDGFAASLTSDNGQSVAVASDMPTWNNAGSSEYANNGFPDPTEDPYAFTFAFQSDNGQGTKTYYDYVYNTLTTHWRNPDGSTGVGTFDLFKNTGTQTVTYPDGTQSISTNDGQGGYFIANYDADGTLSSDKWRHADGSTGSDDFSGGATDAVGSFQRDGVYAIGRTIDGDNSNASVYDVQGALLFSIDEFQHHDGYGGGYAGPAPVDAVDSWQATADVDGATQVQSVRWTAGEAGVPSTQRGQTVMTDKKGEVITTDYVLEWDGTGYSSQTATSTWTTADGSRVNVVLDLATGSGTETIAYRDGSSSSVVATGTKGYLDHDFDAQGKLVGEHWLDDDGTTGTVAFHANGSRASEVLTAGPGSHVSIDLSTADYDKLWFQADGDNLSISVLGSDETVWVSNWQSGQAIDHLNASGGQTIRGSGVAQLVQAMAAFAPPAAGQLSYTPEEQQALAPLLAASWH